MLTTGTYESGIIFYVQVEQSPLGMEERELEGLTAPIRG